MKEQIKIIHGNICQVEVDGIICQANTELELESEITSKLIEAGGEEIQSECNQFSQLQKGNAVATTAGNLPAKYLIHAVINHLNEEAEEEFMMLALRNALQVAKEKMLKTLSTSLIGEGNIGVPIKRAAELMLAEIKRHLEGESSVETIFFVTFDDSLYKAFEEGLRQL